MAADGGDGKKPPFRWLQATRYAVAAVVTVAIVVVIVKAITVVLRPDSLSVSILRGAVFVKRNRQPPQPSLDFTFNLRFVNPSGRARMYYVNVTAYLFDKDKPAATTADPGSDSTIYTPIRPDIVTVGQQESLDSTGFVQGTRDYTDPTDFDMLMRYDGGSGIGNFTVRLDGKLITEREISGGFNTTPLETTYLCWPVLVATRDPNDPAYTNSKDVSCNKKDDQ